MRSQQRLEVAAAIERRRTGKAWRAVVVGVADATRWDFAFRAGHAAAASPNLRCQKAINWSVVSEKDVIEVEDEAHCIALRTLRFGRRFIGIGRT
ncbi:hypothetical protein MTO96_036614 [Rhipicephalus appendiculatus]